MKGSEMFTARLPPVRQRELRDTQGIGVRSISKATEGSERGEGINMTLAVCSRAARIENGTNHATANPIHGPSVLAVSKPQAWQSRKWLRGYRKSVSPSQILRVTGTVSMVCY